jgi:acyl-coenzyme A thioesterase PaaI-like protein
MTESPELIARMRARYDRCFGCGAGNPIGLHLDDFVVDGREVSATFDPRPEYEGFASTLHGGVVATALDEASAWSVMLTEGVLVFTARLEIRYRSPAPTDARYRVHGVVRERRGRRLMVDARMEGVDTTVATSRGLFVVAEEHTAVVTRH